MALMTHLKLGKKRKIEHHVVDPILLSTLEDGPEFATAAASAVSTTESISLSPSSLANETQGPSGMMSIASEKNEAMQPPFVEVEGEFSDYFFMLYGKAHYVCQCLADHIQNSNRQMTTQDEIKRQLEACQIENMGQLYDLLSQIYARFIELSRQGLEKLSVIHYVNIVKNFIDKMNNLQRSFHHVLPYGLVIDHRVPLPSVIYHFYFQVI
ncbi:uncharacterized protein BX663DRAFT_508597 [Cokeromyces recurvatus]|uniref:uncharacterized protein n=1 Tax=Cokeromyces recurvatus TaxID=90255 RepID=UPI00221EBEE2|nr:uncharacterized protein BX663DRAFT_508597 [Cokeromyces recurvatus]KAI7902839.1 hypothetical protein BX663DRAFT_508597 [Cokeromyces recurvatus]